MAKAAKQEGESAPLPTFGRFEGLATFNGAAADAFMKASMAYWHALSELNGELYGFLNRRLRHDMDLGRSMAGSEGWQEAARLQQDWARTTLLGAHGPGGVCGRGHEDHGVLLTGGHGGLADLLWADRQRLEAAGGPR